jgi:hypothetical protein
MGDGMVEWMNLAQRAHNTFCFVVPSISVMEMILKQGPRQKPMKCVLSFGLVTEINARDNHRLVMIYNRVKLNTEF